MPNSRWYLEGELPASISYNWKWPSHKCRKDGKSSNKIFLDNHSIHNPVFNAVGGTLIGILVLFLIVMMVWWLKKKEVDKKRRVVLTPNFVFIFLISIAMKNMKIIQTEIKSGGQKSTIADVMSEISREYSTSSCSKSSSRFELPNLRKERKSV